jgi:hypothetical protein
MHPISRPSMESHVAVIRLKEIPNGFRVLSTETALIESLPEDPKRYIRENILSNQTNHPEKVWCVALFEVEAIDNRNNCSFYDIFGGLGKYSNLAAIQDKAATESFRQVELIKMLNKEL